MTPATPAWGEVEAFLVADGWRRVSNRGGSRQRHVFCEKTLADGRVLQTHVSHSSGKTMSPGRFSAILRYDLEVSKDEFWECIRSGQPVNRPVRLDEGPMEHEAWVVAVLISDLHLTPEEIAGLSPEEAQERVNEYWSRSQ